MSTGNPYEILGIQANASEAEIRKAYRSMVKKFHPDKNPSTAAKSQFLAIQAAYEQLTNGTFKEATKQQQKERKTPTMPT